MLDDAIRRFVTGLASMERLQFLSLNLKPNGPVGEIADHRTRMSMEFRLLTWLENNFPDIDGRDGLRADVSP